MENVINVSNKSTILLRNGRSVHPDFLECIRCAVDERIPSLPLYRKLTIRRICGKGFWRQLDELEKIAAGWCMSHLVSTHQVPFIHADTKYEFPKKYLLE